MLKTRHKLMYSILTWRHTCLAVYTLLSFLSSSPVVIMFITWQCIWMWWISQQRHRSPHSPHVTEPYQGACHPPSSYNVTHTSCELHSYDSYKKIVLFIICKNKHVTIYLKNKVSIELVELLLPFRKKEKEIKMKITSNLSTEFALFVVCKNNHILVEFWYIFYNVCAYIFYIHQHHKNTHTKNPTNKDKEKKKQIRKRKRKRAGAHI